MSAITDKMVERKRLTAARLRKLLTYNPATGVFTRRISCASNARAGSIAGWISGAGRRTIRVDKRHYYAARLAWLYVHGRWPTHEIDHINRVRDDDRLCNLREATHSQNNANCTVKSHNASGFKGIYFKRATGKWGASIRYGKKSYYLGYYTSPQLAHAAYAKAAKNFFGAFACSENSHAS